MKEEENLYNVLGVKQTIRANVVIVNGENYTELKDKEVEIYQGARGIKFYRIDNNLYPVRFFRKDKVTRCRKNINLLWLGLFLLLSFSGIYKQYICFI